MDTDRFIGVITESVIPISGDTVVRKHAAFGPTKDLLTTPALVVPIVQPLRTNAWFGGIGIIRPLLPGYRSFPPIFFHKNTTWPGKVRPGANSEKNRDVRAWIWPRISAPTPPRLYHTS